MENLPLLIVEVRDIRGNWDHERNVYGLANARMEVRFQLEQGRGVCDARIKCADTGRIVE